MCIGVTLRLAHSAECSSPSSAAEEALKESFTGNQKKDKPFLLENEQALLGSCSTRHQRLALYEGSQVNHVPRSSISRGLIKRPSLLEKDAIGVVSTRIGFAKLKHVLTEGSHWCSAASTIFFVVT